MSRLIRAFAALLLAAALAAPAALADPRPWVFDRAHSQINFIAEALLISAHGHFDRFDGDIRIDPENLENSTLRLVIEAASINTRNDRRDNHLRSADFFDAENHPQITFESRSIRRVDEKNLLVAGDLTIRGNTRRVEIPLEVVFLRDGRGRFRGQLQVNRQDYGVSFNPTLNRIEDMVTVQFDLNLLDQKAIEQRRRQQQQQQQQPPQ
jgi:polyisoprenoid-binding protein YceI